MFGGFNHSVKGLEVPAFEIADRVAALPAPFASSLERIRAAWRRLSQRCALLADAEQRPLALAVEQIDAIGGECRVNRLTFLESDLARQQHIQHAFRRRFRPHKRRMAKGLDGVDGAGDAERVGSCRLVGEDDVLRPDPERDLRGRGAGERLPNCAILASVACSAGRRMRSPSMRPSRKFIGGLPMKLAT